MKSVKEVKTAVKLLRKELAKLEKPASELSFNDTLHLFAKALNYPDWNTLRSRLEPEDRPRRGKRDGFLVEETVDVEVGRLPAYRYKSLQVSLDYLPDVDPGHLYVDFTELDTEGQPVDESSGNLSLPVSSLPATDTSEAAYKARRAFVEQAATLVAPYLNEGIGVRALDFALCALADGSVDEARLQLERLKATPAVRDQVPPGTSGRLETLEGEAIIGSFESLKGCALIKGATRNPDGTLELEWVGETEVWWDEQRTVRENGEPIFVTESIELVPLSQVRLVPDRE